MSTEIWKPIVGLEDCGFVSNMGHIRNKHGKLRKTNVGKHGYERVGFHGGKTTILVHRLVARAFCEGHADHLEVNHKDGNKSNNVAENLEWVTASDNIKHAYANGFKTHNRHNMIIKDEDLPYLLKRRLDGETYRTIAKDYGVDRRTLFKRLKEYNGGLIQCR